MDNPRLTELLADIPETRLAIFDIARQSLTDDGTIDGERFVNYPDTEAQTAIDEANNYLRKTNALNDRLAQLAARSPR